MEPFRVLCYYDDEGTSQRDSFIIEHEPKYLFFRDVPEDFKMSKEQATEFIRLLNIRLQKIS
jgi:hypothetical protein